MWNSEFSPNKWVFEKSPNIHLLPSLIQIHPHFWCKYYYTDTIYLSFFVCGNFALSSGQSFG